MRGLRNPELPPVAANTTSSHCLLNSVRHDQSKWMGNPSANVSRPTPYDARPSLSRKPETVVGLPRSSIGFPLAFRKINPEGSVWTPITGVQTSSLLVANL